MKTLHQFIGEAVAEHTTGISPAEPDILTLRESTTTKDLIDDIIKAIQEYKKMGEQFLCIGLEFFKDGELSYKSIVSDTCTLVYIVRKE